MLLVLSLTLPVSLVESVPAADPAQSSNPIGRVARLFNPRLVEVEDPIDWQENRLHGLSAYLPRPLKGPLDWRPGKIESEPSLLPIRTSMVSQSQLNATWGASIAIGLTLLIPVAILERRRLVSRNQIDALRQRLASDLHDEIGSNLGSISLIARAAKRDLERLHGPDVISHDLREIEVIARESSHAMRDIVWLLEQRQDTIGDFVQRLQDTASRLLRDVHYKVACRSNCTASKITVDAKRHLFLFYKEALHNILKHSQATEVDVRIFDSQDRLVMEVRDNGVGLHRDKDNKPIIGRKLTERAVVLDGQLHVESEPGEGTILRLAVKRSTLTTIKEAA